MEEKYLFLYLKTWWWHISTAKALEKYFAQNFSDTEIVLADGFQETNKMVQSIVIDGYTKAQTYGKWMYEFLYLCNKSYPFAKLNQHLMSFFTKPYLQKLIQQERPSKIVIFHFFLVKPVLKALKELWLDIPVVTVVTDPFTGTRTRFMEKDIDYIVFSERIKHYALDLWVAEKNIKVFPPIIHEKFLIPIDKEKIPDIKKLHHISLDKKVILLLGGGDGLPKWKTILKELAQSKTGAHIIIVCGRNKNLFDQAHKIKSDYPQLSLQIHGFVDFAHDLLNASNIVISKWWPATIFEILLCGKIPLIHTYMREQEKWNVEFVVDNKVGKYEKNIKKLTHIAAQMLDGDLSSYQDAIKNLDLKIWTKEIAEYIKSL